MTSFDDHIIGDPGKLAAIKTAMLETYFSNYDPAFLETEYGKIDMDANVCNRYNAALTHIVPWVSRQIDLAGKTVVEIGCGTGSSTAAFAPFVAAITGYDIDRLSLDAAQRRMEILDLDNVALKQVTGSDLIEQIRADHGNGADIFLLYAVLEHQTIAERHATIAACWNLLNENGLLVVVETPNLLTYFDHHTSVLPFFHMLPSELCARYAVRSPRDGFNRAYLKYADMTRDELALSFDRMGRGVSYHDFELTLGENYRAYMVNNGFEPEILSWVGVSLEEELLRYYVLKNRLDVPLGFTRVSLNVIFKKRDAAAPADIDDNVPPLQMIGDPAEVHELRRIVHEKNQWIDAVRQDCRPEAFHALRQSLEAKDRALAEILSSKKWRLITFLAKPYMAARKYLGLLP